MQRYEWFNQFLAGYVVNNPQEKINDSTYVFID